MEYRKLISFGKSSYVVSLPKAWVNQNKLKKGDLIYLEEGNDGLTLYPRAAETEADKEITIYIDGKTKRQIQRELIPAYINNFKTIILAGKEVKDKAREIEPIIQNLIALEIMEQTSNKIMARDFLNMRDIQIINLIRKMDIIIRSMFEDCENIFNEDTYENINHRDRDVNRLSYLIFRVVYYSFENQSFAIKKFKLTPAELIRYYLLTYHLEAIADDVRRIARYMRLIKVNPSDQKAFACFINQAKKNYLDSLKAFYNNDLALILSVAEKKEDLTDGSEKFFIKNQTANCSHLIDHFRRLVVNIHKMGRIVYQ